MIYYGINYKQMKEYKIWSQNVQYVFEDIIL